MLFPIRQRLRSALPASLLIALLGVNATVGAVDALRVAELVTALGRSTVIAANHLEADGAGKIRFVADAFRMTNALLAMYNHASDVGTTPIGYHGFWGVLDAVALMKSHQVASPNVVASSESSMDQLASLGAAVSSVPSTVQTDAVSRPPNSDHILAMWQQQQASSGAAVSGGLTTDQVVTPGVVVDSVPVTAQAATPDVVVGSDPVVAQVVPDGAIVSVEPTTEQEADKTAERIAQVLLSDILPAIETAAAVWLAVDGMLDKPEHKKIRVCLQSLTSLSRTLQVCLEYRTTPEARMYLGFVVGHTLLTLWEIFRNYNVLLTPTPAVIIPVNSTPIQQVAVLPVAPMVPAVVATNSVVTDSSAASTTPMTSSAPASTAVSTTSMTTSVDDSDSTGSSSTPVLTETVSAPQTVSVTTAVEDKGASQGAPVQPVTRRVAIPSVFLSATAAPMNSASVQAQQVPTGQRRVIFGNGLSILVNDGSNKKT